LVCEMKTLNSTLSARNIGVLRLRKLQQIAFKKKSILKHEK